MVRVFDNLDPNMLVFLSFDKVKDTPEGEERGCLTIQFARPDNDYIYFACHPDEVWERVLFKFNAAPEILSARNAGRARREEALASRRVTINTLDGYIYLEECYADGIIRVDGDRWLNTHDSIVSTLMSLTKRITYPDVHQVRSRPPIAGSFAAIHHGQTLQDMPKVQLWAPRNDWMRLHRKVLGMPDIGELATLSVFSSLFQITFGMTKVFDDQGPGFGNHAICPERHVNTDGIVRILPRWIHDVCELDDMN
ncbi:hypothetical protein CMUS01_00504 [Colletotrichum musicola]|uniref:Uncharacterized protein n=1 Tax=Colletotrichum musicola TaxID=2175873 RepID=A0A8H6U9D2_9PEZI|nr:hypothetical protein CMUS01_00504 [Colletotrichum musicola]